MYVVTTVGVGPGTSKMVVTMCVSTFGSSSGRWSSIGRHWEYHSLLGVSGCHWERSRRGNGEGAYLSPSL